MNFLEGFLGVLLTLIVFIILAFVYFACFFILLCIIDWIFHIVGTWVFDTLSYIFGGISIVFSAVTTYYIARHT